MRKKIHLSFDARIVLSIEESGLHQESLAVRKAWLIGQSLSVVLKDRVETAIFEQSDTDCNLKIRVCQVSAKGA